MRLPSPMASFPETAGPREGAQGLGRGLPGPGADWSGRGRSSGFTGAGGVRIPDRTRGTGRGGNWDFQILAAPPSNSLGWGLAFPRDMILRCGNALRPGLQAGPARLDRGGNPAPGLGVTQSAPARLRLEPRSELGPESPGPGLCGPRRSSRRQLGGWGRVLRFG